MRSASPTGVEPGSRYGAPEPDGTFLSNVTRKPGRLRVALMVTPFAGGPVDPECIEATRAAARLCESLGHHVEPAKVTADVPMMMRAWTDIVGVGTALGVKKALKGRPLTADLVEGVSRGACAHADTLHPTRYLEAVGEIHAFGRQMAGFFDGGPDILLSATLAEPPARIGRFNHDSEDYVSYRIGPKGIFAYSPFCAVFNASGQPAASLPLAMSASGLPIGIHLAAAFGCDEVLISLCSELEQAQPWLARRAPIAGGVQVSVAP